MGSLLKLVGLGWAALGVVYMYSLTQESSNETTLGFGLMIAMLLFILPGLVVGGLGSIADKRSGKQDG